MAKLILDIWRGSKYVYIEKCDVLEIQDRIVLKLIQDYSCRIKSPRRSLINIVRNEDLHVGMKIYNEVNGIMVNVSDKANWIIKNNVIFLKITKTSLDTEITLMIVNADKIGKIKEEDIYNLIKDALLCLNYEVDW